jgi:hypothetical protein
MNSQTLWIAVAAVAAFAVIGLIAAAVRRSRAANVREVRASDLRELTAGERSHYRSAWWRVEAHFIERPSSAVVEAHDLITAVMQSRGYKDSHPAIVEHYRPASAVIDAKQRDAASTEDLRQAMLHYRALFDEMVGGRVAGEDIATEIASHREVEAPRARVTGRAAHDEDRPRE